MVELNIPIPRERQVSKKIWIRELLDGTIEQSEKGNVLLSSRGPAARINIIGVVIDKEEMPVSSITVDDGTGQIVVRSFDQKMTQAIGTVVQIIGRPRAYQGQLYVASEVTTIVDAGWLHFRKKELGEVVQTVTQKIVVNETVTAPGSSENRAEKILRMIKELDAGDGAPIEMVALKSGIKEAEEIIEQLLLTGDIFELRPGKVKVL